MTLNGSRVVVLGGTSGIGLATAQAAAAEGARVVVASSRAASVERALASLPPGAEGHAADLADEAQVKRLFDALGAFDHLVYTAGESLMLGPVAGTAVDDARRFLDVRVWGAFAAVRHGAPHLRPGGSIVLTSGIAGARPRSGWAVGALICSGMEGLARALAMELAPTRVNAVSPGVVRTPLWSGMGKEDREAMYRATAAALPAGRVGEPDDIAQAYLFLLRDSFATGQVVTVDGGAVLA